jgi:hypothetical protein
MSDDPWQRCLLLLKTMTLEAKNIPAHCHGEESIDYLSTTLLALCLTASISLFNTSTKNF